MMKREIAVALAIVLGTMMAPGAWAQLGQAGAPGGVGTGMGAGPGSGPIQSTQPPIGAGSLGARPGVPTPTVPSVPQPNVGTSNGPGGTAGVSPQQLGATPGATPGAGTGAIPTDSSSYGRAPSSVPAAPGTSQAAPPSSTSPGIIGGAAGGVDRNAVTNQDMLPKTNPPTSNQQTQSPLSTQ